MNRLVSVFFSLAGHTSVPWDEAEAALQKSDLPALLREMDWLKPDALPGLPPSDKGRTSAQRGTAHVYLGNSLERAVLYPAGAGGKGSGRGLFPVPNPDPGRAGTLLPLREADGETSLSFPYGYQRYECSDRRRGGRSHCKR